MGRCCIIARKSFKLVGCCRQVRIGAKMALDVVSSSISFSSCSNFRCLKFSLRHPEHMVRLVVHVIGILRIPCAMSRRHLVAQHSCGMLDGVD